MNRLRLQEIEQTLIGDPRRHKERAMEIRIEELEGAIRKHRDERGDDRCWMDDVELYAVVGDTTQPDFTLPPRAEFLGNCARFFDCRQRNTTHKEAVQEYKAGTELHKEAGGAHT